MIRSLSSALLIASMFSIIPGVTLLAQPVQNGPAGGGGGKLATPTYEPGTRSNPAINPSLRSTMTNVPASQNPKTPGATGKVVVPGNHSSIAADRSGIIEQKTGAASTGGTGGGGK